MFDVTCMEYGNNIVLQIKDKIKSHFGKRSKYSVAMVSLYKYMAKYIYYMYVHT